MYLKSCFVGFLVASTEAATLLLNGAQSGVLPNATTACLNAFNTSLNCASSIQKLGYDFTYINFAASDFSALCTSACTASMSSLEAAVKSGCGSYSFLFNTLQMTAVQIVDLYWWKYNMSCLMSKETGQPCLLQQKTWNVTQLQQSNNITWPKYTNKTYPDWWDNPTTGYPMVDVNDTAIPDPFPEDYTLFSFPSNLPPTAIDIYNANGTGVSYNANAGYSSELEYDEYPLQIQCQSCFINQFITSIQSQWGETYDTIKAQVWSNMKQNCGITQTIVAANNITNQANTAPFPNYKTVCPQSITVSNTNSTCTSVAQANKFESNSLFNLNQVVYCPQLVNGTYCATVSCQVATISSSMSTGQFLNSSAAGNMTMFEFQAWNPFTSPDLLNVGDVVCVGPPGGSYVPTTVVSQAYPTIFTTTASHPSPTPSGTIPNCGSYYLVQQGDYCDSVALNKSITFSELINLNPSINCNCTNLLLGFDYCVAPVQGTNVTSTTCTNPTTTSTPPPSSCTKYVAPPTQTVSGTTANCCTWYTTKSGDSCYTIDQTYGITLSQFQAWNTYINSQCSNLFVGYAYCVLSSVPVSGSAAAKDADKKSSSISKHASEHSTKHSTEHVTKTAH